VSAPEQRDLRNSSYEVFILLLSLLSLANIVLAAILWSDDARDVVLVIDGVLCIVFLADFAYRLFTADSKRGYFLQGGGWLDLIGSLPAPGLRLARLFRVMRAWRAISAYGVRALARDFMRQRAQGAMYVVLLLVVLVLELSSIGVLAAERDEELANIQTASDALWWGYVTITTVGYGDRFPVTNGGRIVGVFLLTVGVGLFATFTGFLANFFLAPNKEDEEELEVDGLRSRLEEHERSASRIRAQLADLEPGQSA
jgi:voltage-gated potassium channel Kch